MPIDSSIYFQQQTPDFLGSIQKGLSLGQMISERNRQRDLNEAYKAGGGDEEKTLSELASRGFGQEALAAKEQFQKVKTLDQQYSVQKEENDRKRQTYEMGLISQEAGSILQQNSQEAYERGLANLSKSGIDISQMPRAYDPNLVRGYYDRAITASQRMSHEAELERIRSDRANRAESRENRLYEKSVRQDEKAQALKTPFGLANTPDDAKNLKEAFESKKGFDSKLNELIALRKQYGGEVMNREAVNRASQLSKDLLLEYKNMAKLGVLSKSDEDIINAIIPSDPLAFRPLEAAMGQDSILNNLEKFKKDSDSDFKTKISTRTRAGVETAASEIDREIIKVQAPNGKIYNVPKEKYGAAIAAGGKRVK